MTAATLRAHPTGCGRSAAGGTFGLRGCGCAAYGAMTSMKSGPDFLCVGMQKAGTRTLHSLLSVDDRFWMPLVKEFHHFDDPKRPLEERHGKVLDQDRVMERGGIALAGWNLARRLTGRRALTKDDRKFVRKYRAYLASGRTDADYLDLFSLCPEGRVAGDVTPGYSMLDRTEIERVHRLLPEARILLLIRDPVSRAWSHGNMKMRRDYVKRQGMSEKSALEAMGTAAGSDDYLTSLVGRPSVIGKGSPSQIYRSWTEFYGERVEVFSFEEICDAQGAVVERIAALFGMPAKPGQLRDRIVPNRKSRQAKVPMGKRERQFLVDHFRDELFACRELFGEEKTRGWLEKYGLA